MTNRKRNHNIFIRMTDEEYQLFQVKHLLYVATLHKKFEEANKFERAFNDKLYKISKQDFVMYCIFNDEEKSLYELTDAVKEIRKIGVNVNQIAKAVNAGIATHEEILFLRKEMEDIWHYLKQLQATHLLQQQ